MRRWSRALRSATALFVAALLVTGCGSTSAPDAAGAVTSAEVATRTEQAAVSELVQALNEGGHQAMASAVEELGQFALLPDGDFTVLAATDDAFLQLTSDATADLLSDPDLLVRTLQNHIIEGKLTPDDIRDLSSVTTVAGSTLDVVVQDDVVYVNGAIVTPGESTIDRGLMHSVDALFLP